jgi:hypothetical protein
MMNEILFSEPAKHYLLSTDLPNETMLVTVSPSEVTILLQRSAPEQLPETTFIAGSTLLTETSVTIFLRQKNREEEEEDKDRQELAFLFLSRIENSLALVQQRQTDEDGDQSSVLANFRNNIKSLLSQVQ